MQQELDDMQQQELVYKLDDFCMPCRMISSWPPGEQRQQVCRRWGLEKPRRLPGFIPFSFVNGLAISGSLSKNYADENSDIDFFLLLRHPTVYGLPATLMHIFINGPYSKSNGCMFCMNYYVSETALHIPEQNILPRWKLLHCFPVKVWIALKISPMPNWVKTLFSQCCCKTPILSKLKRIYPKGTCRKFVGKPGNKIDNWLLNSPGNTGGKNSSKKLNNKFAPVHACR